MTYPDSKQQIIHDWNYLHKSLRILDSGKHPNESEDFNYIYRSLKVFAENMGKQQRITAYKESDKLQQPHAGISETFFIRMDKKKNKTITNEFIRLYERAKKVRKRT